ncbi:CBS domain-containing protein [Desulfovirgula thermocuniculi]|uniref:CBS domain-containing protein n=1 Tax=Desulfovirgula thermocuniculi TaxID=348842 RepID=UPI000401F042|nr:CBS domain-containing protein [Desulfovirgula thermocuniculi]
MPENRKVAELMVPLAEYPVVYETDTLKEAILTLRNYRAAGHHHRSVLVFSRTKKVQGEEMLVGILTTRDILNAIKKNKMLYDNTELFTMSWAFFYRREPLEELTITRVGQAIRPLVDAYVQADDTVTRAIELMMTKNVNILPVFEGKKAVGIIRAIDLLDYIADMLA